MKDVIRRIDESLKVISEYIKDETEENLSHKPSPKKWSKKEIVGHLIDSSIYNLQRFNEIQFASKPFKIEAYRQEELVSVNAYNLKETDLILNMWIALNEQIKHVVQNLDKEVLNYAVELPYGDPSNLEDLIVSYTDHMEHHVKQILLE